MGKSDALVGALAVALGAFGLWYFLAKPKDLVLAPSQAELLAIEHARQYAAGGAAAINLPEVLTNIVALQREKEEMGIYTPPAPPAPSVIDIISAGAGGGAGTVTDAIKEIISAGGVEPGQEYQAIKLKQMKQVEELGIQYVSPGWGTPEEMDGL